MNIYRRTLPLENSPLGFHHPCERKERKIPLFHSILKNPKLSVKQAMAVAAFGKSFVLLQSIHGLRPPQILHDIIAPHSAAISTRRRNISSLSTEDSLIKRLTDELKDLAEERRVRNAAPDWLPFRPGSSYWLPGSRHLDYDDSERSLKKQEDREKMVLFDSSLDSEN